MTCSPTTTSAEQKTIPPDPSSSVVTSAQSAAQCPDSRPSGGETVSIRSARYGVELSVSSKVTHSESHVSRNCSSTSAADPSYV